MPNTFLQYYLHERDEPYVYKIKFATDEFTNEQMDKLEMALAKYELKVSEPVRSTPIQEHPLDFPNITNTRVHTTNVTLTYPASGDALRLAASEYTGVPIAAVAVYPVGDPREQYTQDAIAEDEEYTPRLGSDLEEGEDASGLYGKELTDEVMRIAKEKKDARRVDVVTNSLVPDQVIDDVGVGGKDVGEAGGFSTLGGK